MSTVVPTSLEPEPELEETLPKLSNRGNKLSGEENPGSVRPKMWSNKRSSTEIINETDDFEVHTLYIRCVWVIIPFLDV